MQEFNQNRESECPGTCPSCLFGKEGRRPSSELCGHAGLHGWKMVVFAIVVFLLPLLLAVCGAVIASGRQVKTEIGVLIGLVAGIVIAVIFARIFRRFHKET